MKEKTGLFHFFITVLLVPLMASVVIPYSYSSNYEGLMQYFYRYDSGWNMNIAVAAILLVVFAAMIVFFIIFICRSQGTCVVKNLVLGLLAQMFMLVIAIQFIPVFALGYVTQNMFFWILIITVYLCLIFYTARHSGVQKRE